MWNQLRHQWRVWREWQRLRTEHTEFHILAQAGAIFSRPLNQHDTVACCNWVLENCVRSSRGTIGRGNVRIALKTRHVAQSTIDQAFADGLTPKDDWVLHRVRFMLEDSKERMLFKLTWG